MKHSELEEMIRRVVRERALTKAEKKKKEDIVKGMKKSFKGDKASMYAIATAKAKKIAEADDSIKVNQPDYKGTIRKVEGGYQLYDVNGNVEDKEVGPFKTMSSLMSYYDISMDQLNEVKGTELTSKIFDVGSTLKKIESAIDFGMDQDPEVVNGLDQAYAELVHVLSLIEKDREANRFVNEGSDHEVSMAKNSLKAIAKATVELNQKLGDEERNIPGWVQDHIAKAENYIEQAAQGFHELDEEKDPIDVVVAEKKAKDLTGPGGKPDGKIDSADYLKARDIAIKQAQAKKK